MKISINRDPNRPHLLDIEDAIVHGIHNALIMNNLERVPKGTQYDDFARHFPYLSRENFYFLLQDLIKKGIVQLENDSDLT